MPNKISLAYLDPLECGYWVGQKITMPPMPFEDWDEDVVIDGKHHGYMTDTTTWLSKQVGKIVVIECINNRDHDPVDEIYITVAGEGGEFNVPFNFGEWFPIEIAMKIGYAGLGHFGDKNSLKSHPHYNLWPKK